MAQRRIRLNLGGGALKTASGGVKSAGSMKGLRVRKVKKQAVKQTASQAEAEAPQLDETQARVHGKQDVSEDVTPGGSMPRPLAEKPAGGVVRVGTARLKKIKPGGGVGWS